MPKLIAIEWDTREARVVVAQPRGSDVALENAFAVDLAAAGAEPLSAQQAGEKIAAALAARKVGRGEVLVAVGRASN